MPRLNLVYFRVFKLDEISDMSAYNFAFWAQMCHRADVGVFYDAIFDDAAAFDERAFDHARTDDAYVFLQLALADKFCSAIDVDALR